MGERETGAVRGERASLPLDQVVAYAVAAVRRYGWVSAATARRDGVPATKDVVLRSLFPASREDHERAALPEDRDWEEARALIAEARSYLAVDDERAVRELFSFARNLRALVRAGNVGIEGVGIAVALPAYVEQERERRRPPRSRPVGHVGERIECTAKVVGVRPLEPNAYGPVTLVRFEDEAGNRLVWYANGVPRCRVGDVCTVRATVKRHVEREGRGVETVVTRVRVS